MLASCKAVRRGLECYASAPAAFQEALARSPDDDSEQLGDMSRARSSGHTSARVVFVLNSTTTRDSLELCWNPSAGSMHNLLDHTISVGHVIFVKRPLLRCESSTKRASQLLSLSPSDPCNWKAASLYLHPWRFVADKCSASSVQAHCRMLQGFSQQSS